MTDDTPMKSLRGRPPSTVPKDKFHISIDASVGLFYRSLFYDELSGRMKQGPFSELVERLLREHKEQLQRNFQQQQPQQTPEGEPRD